MIEELITSIDPSNIALVIALVWVALERRDNSQIWSIVESLVKLRLRQFEDNSDDVYMELE